MIKVQYKKYEDEVKAHVFDVLPEYYNPWESLTILNSQI